MPLQDGSFWHTLGKAVGSAGAMLPGAIARSAPNDDPPPSGPGREATPRVVFSLLAGGAAALLVTLSVRRGRAHRPSPSLLVRGAVAGASAAAIALAARELLAQWGDDPREDVPDLLDQLLSGAGRGILYAAVVDPYLPGAPFLKGALAGTADHLAAPLGGLFAQIQPLSPIHRVPVVSALLEVGASEENPYLIDLCNGILLGVLYGRSSAPSGK